MGFWRKEGDFSLILPLFSLHTSIPLKNGRLFVAKEVDYQDVILSERAARQRMEDGEG